MSFNAELLLFDYAAYENQFKPAYQAWLEHGELVPWLSGFAGRRRRDHVLWELGAWEPACAYFSPAHQSCDREVLYSALAEACIKHGLFLGRSLHPEGCRAFIQRQWKAHASARLLYLFEQLATRSLLMLCDVCYQTEAPQGWLDPEETQELAELLRELPLPRYVPQVGLLQTLQQLAQPYEDEQPRHWYAVMLSLIGALASLAAEQGLGLLWSHDYAVWSQLNPRGVFVAAQPRFQQSAIEIWQQFGTPAQDHQPRSSLAIIEALGPDRLYRRHADAVLRILNIVGQHFPRTNHGIQFKLLETGEHSLIFDESITWHSSERLQIDFQQLEHALWPGDQLELVLRIMDTQTYQPLSAWSHSFSLLDPDAVSRTARLD